MKRRRSKVDCLEVPEPRNGVKRDIDRNIRLDATEAGMKEALRGQGYETGVTTP